MKISSLVDTWILLRDTEAKRERRRGIYILKSRGMNHSNQVQEFALTDQGIRILPGGHGPQSSPAASGADPVGSLATLS